MVMKTILTATYGFDITEEVPNYVEVVIDGLNRGSALGAPGINIIDFLPFCECSLIIRIRLHVFTPVFISAFHSAMVSRSGSDKGDTSCE